MPVAAVEAQLQAHDAFSQAVPESYYFCLLPDTRTAEIRPKDELVPHYRFEWVLLAGYDLQPPYFQHFMRWAMRQIELGAAIDKAVAKHPIEPLDATFDHDSEDWLENWRKAGKTPLLDSEDPKVWRVLEAHWLRKPLRFIYWGGSDLGAIREVIPKEVFHADGYRSIWFRGICSERKAERTFKIERVEFED